MTGADVEICEVGPRDGLQNEDRVLTVAERVAFIDRLSDCGLQRIEAVSFVHPRLVPQMADAEAVMAGIRRRGGTTYAGLALNRRGAERAVNAGVDEIHYAMVSTETFNQRNQGATQAESLDAFRGVVAHADRNGLRCAAIIGASFGCPFEGRVDPSEVVRLARQLHAAGAHRIVLSDTIGVAVPTQVRSLVNAVKAELGDDVPLGVHLHNTRNTGIANAFVAIEAGVRTIDSSLGGAGGCPFAPEATGNIPTEDLAYLMREIGVDPAVDIEGLIDTAVWLEGELGHSLPGMVMRAGLFPEVVFKAA